jgi:hypothetical protein
MKEKEPTNDLLVRLPLCFGTNPFERKFSVEATPMQMNSTPMPTLE